MSETYPIVTDWDCYDPAHTAGTLVLYHGRVHVVIQTARVGLRLAALQPSVEAELNQLQAKLAMYRHMLKVLQCRIAAENEHARNIESNFRVADGRVQVWDLLGQWKDLDVEQKEAAEAAGGK